MKDDLISRQAAIRLVHSVLYEMRVEAAAADIEKPMSKEDKLLLRVNKVVCTKLRELQPAEPEIIKCKYCRWGREADGIIECFVDSNIPSEYHGYEWFCPNGERKQE